MKKFRKILAAVLALVLVVCLAQPAAPAIQKGTVTGSLNLTVVSDIHLYIEEMMGNKGEQWMADSRNHGKLFYEADALLSTALKTIGEQAKENGTEYGLIPGDLT